jgi:hypothetical protein
MTTLPVVTVTVTVAGMYKSECGMLLEGGKKGDETSGRGSSQQQASRSGPRTFSVGGNERRGSWVAWEAKAGMGRPEHRGGWSPECVIGCAGSF